MYRVIKLVVVRLINRNMKIKEVVVLYFVLWLLFQCSVLLVNDDIIYTRLTINKRKLFNLSVNIIP
jgi:hypothetical protein